MERECCLIYFTSFVFCRIVCVAGSNTSEMLEMVAIYKEADQLTQSHIYTTAPSLSNDLFTKGRPKDRYRGFVSSVRNERTNS